MRLVIHHSRRAGGFSRLRLAGFASWLLLAGCGTGPSAPNASSNLAPRDLLTLGKVTRDEAQEVVGLVLHHTDVTDVELQQLGALKKLRELTIQECSKITDDGLASLRELDSLQKLKLIQVPVTDAALESLSSAAALDELMLANTHVGGYGLGRLAATPLAHLTVRSNVVVPEGLGSVTELSHLRSLELQCGRIVIEDLPSFESFSELESLVLSRTSLGPRGLARLAGLAKLKRLLLNAADVGDAELPILNTLPELEELELNDARITNDGLAQLELPKLKRLSLDGCLQISDAGLANLGGLGSLAHLNLFNTGVSGRDLSGLAEVATLRRVTLSSQQFKGGKLALAELKERLPDCEVLLLGG